MSNCQQLLIVRNFQQQLKVLLIGSSTDEQHMNEGKVEVSVT
jgi:hypothetical protein